MKKSKTRKLRRFREDEWADLKKSKDEKDIKTVSRTKIVQRKTGCGTIPVRVVAERNLKNVAGIK